MPDLRATTNETAPRAKPC